MARPKLMLVENDPYFIYLLKLYAEQCGFAVVTSSSASTACAMAQEERPNVIVLESELPEITGWEILDTLRADPCTGEIPVIMCLWQDSVPGSLGAPPLDSQGRQIKMTASEVLLHKPMQFDDFVAALKGLGVLPEDNAVVDNRLTRMRPSDSVDALAE